MRDRAHVGGRVSPSLLAVFATGSRSLRGAYMLAAPFLAAIVVFHDDARYRTSCGSLPSRRAANDDIRDDYNEKRIGNAGEAQYH